MLDALMIMLSALLQQPVIMNIVAGLLPKNCRFGATTGSEWCGSSPSKLAAGLILIIYVAILHVVINHVHAHLNNSSGRCIQQG